MKILISVIFLLSAGLMSCSKSKVPNGILEPEKMQAVYWDYMRADIYANELIRNDSNRNANKENIQLQKEVFELHKVTKEEFYKSYDYYLNHSSLMKQMLDTMTVRQQKKIDMLKEKKAREDSIAAKLKENRGKADSILTKPQMKTAQQDSSPVKLQNKK